MRGKLGKLSITAVILIVVPALLFAGEATDAFNEGVKFYRAGKFKEAIAAYDKAIKAAPNAAEAYLGRGSARAKLGQQDAAVKDYDEAIKLNPDLADAYFNTRRRSKIMTRRYAAMLNSRRPTTTGASPITNWGNTTTPLRALTKPCDKTPN